MEDRPQSVGIWPVRGLMLLLAGIASMAIGYAYAWDCSSSIMNECRPFGLFTQDSLGAEFVSSLFLMPGIAAVLAGAVWTVAGLWLRLCRL